ncbi:hypothetical protein Tco_0593437 [Tanacetum coccineum]
MLEAPTVGYEDAIVVPEITADNFELKHGLLTLVQNKHFFGLDKGEGHSCSHLLYSTRSFLTIEVPNVPSTSVKIMLFLFSLEGAARIWLDKEPPQSILTWDDLVSKPRFFFKCLPFELPEDVVNKTLQIILELQSFKPSLFDLCSNYSSKLFSNTSYQQH